MSAVLDVIKAFGMLDLLMLWPVLILAAVLLTRKLNEGSSKDDR